ncbi:ROK family transcriptional regulator [Amnibacterium setariae]|uniref:ROK family transcriptional regulator n=1 Tax=Amnibacterium setariae TaxID=2306585 RepID=A0A3A1TZE8_9MICO|nr:ROK family transcriptional regulator [Amnibacterium setariae]RIX30024.1 ROK family transcriptional regulator [Amnibacterium setariae]
MTLPERLSDTASRALRTLLAQGRATRPELAAALAVTKQTVSAAIAELEERGLVEAVAVQQGRTGRSALRYALHRSAGWVAGIDLGSARLRVAAARLDGTVVAERLVPNPAPTVSRDWPDQLELAAHALAEVAQELSESEGGLLGAAIAVPRAVPERRDLLADGGAEADDRLLAALAPVAPAAVWTENDVNCEAVAQLRYRPGPTPPSVLHLHVGAGLGVALIVEGAILRGARGRAGEIKGLAAPIPRGATAEEALAVGGLLEAAGHSRAAPLPGALDDLFAAAETGDPVAETALADEARGIGLLLRDLVAVLDPDLVVLSGTVGARPALHRRVVAEADRLGLGVEVAEDPLGDAAPVLGAAGLAADLVLDAVAPVR